LDNDTHEVAPLDFIGCVQGVEGEGEGRKRERRERKGRRYNYF